VKDESQRVVTRRTLLGHTARGGAGLALAGAFGRLSGSDSAEGSLPVARGSDATPPPDASYRDPSRPIAERVEDLLGRMTLAEKVGQLNTPFLLPEEFADIAAELGAPGMPTTVEEVEGFVAGTHDPVIGPGGGFFAAAERERPEDPEPEGSRRQAAYLNALQQVAVTRTRLGIPLLQIAEGTHGVLVPGATIFPEGPALGSAWDPDLIREIYAAAAREARALGLHALSTLVVEPTRDPRLGRGCEGYGEDPHLVARYAAAIVDGVQGDDVAAADKAVALLTVFPGQTQPTGGIEKGPMELSERGLREVFLPSWEAGVRDGGALAAMAGYPAVDGVPTHASEHWLTDVLRGELGFEGILVSEGFGFRTLLYEGVAATQQEAGVIALRAGVDVSISYEEAFVGQLADAIEQGMVKEDLIDRAVRRVLALKFRLGLFEEPYGDPDRAAAVVHRREHQDLALRAAREGIVLLKNEGNLLPLRKDVRSIAVIGPNADNGRNLLGDYVTGRVLQPITTVLGGIRAKLGPGVTVTHEPGCEIVGDDRSGFAAAVAAAQAAEVAIVVVGERSERLPGDDPAGEPTVGERYDVASLDLSGQQEALIQSIHATGTPTVVVLVNGRPLSIRWTAEHVPAIVEAWLPGERGGEAVADVLFGDHNPGGRLPVSVPRHAGQLPITYDHGPSKAFWLEQGAGYRDMPATPLYPFGFGLSYTTFEYANLRIDPGEIAPSGTARVLVDVTNTGGWAGQETVQLYVRDLLGAVTTAAKRLRGFVKLALAPGETKTAEFALGPAELALLDRDLQRTVEPGDFEVILGASAEDTRLRARLTVSA